MYGNFKMKKQGEVAISVWNICDENFKTTNKNKLNRISRF